MVNILKHRKINNNPFVKYLKNFSENGAESIKELSQAEGKLEHFIGNGRSIIIKNGFFYLVNYNYVDVIGCFKIPIEDLIYTTGTIYIDVDFKDVPEVNKSTFGRFYSSKEELYKIIAEFDNQSDNYNLS